MERNQFTPEQEQWLSTLESDKYQQGRDYLWTVIEGGKTGYCCLGVGTAMFEPDSPHISPHAKFPARSRDTVAPTSLAMLLELHSCTGSFVDGWWEHKTFTKPEEISRPFINISSLADANDQGLSFKQIAAFCRKHPWVMFNNFDVPK